jgi:copper(I)-binding protein
MKIPFLLLIPVLAASGSAAADGIRIEKTASHSMVPGATVGDGYITIVNDGAEPDRLVSARSPRAANVQLHRMDMTNGVMTMRDVKGGLTIPPHTTLKLEPDYHLMFNGVTERFRQGEQVPAILTFERAGDVPVSFTVGRIAGPLDDPQQPANTMLRASTDGGSTHEDPIDTKPMDMGAMDMSAMHQEHPPEEDPAGAVSSVLKTMFETQDKPLEVEPVVSNNGWAIAGWRQAGHGGRVLLQHGSHGWQARALGGDGLKSEPGLAAAGVPATVAKDLADTLAETEAALAPGMVKLMGDFGGTIALAGGAAEASHASHEGH